MAEVGASSQRALVLIGFMGAGKSTFATHLAEQLGVRPLDSDELLEARLGHSPAAEFELRGEASFRAAEEQLVCELLANAEPGSVIALGGGSLSSERVRLALEPHVVVLLDVEAEQAWERVTGAGDPSHGGSSRPLARDREAFFALHAERRGVYEQAADAFLPASELAVSPGMLSALRALSAAPAATRLVWARSGSAEYPVLLGRGLLRAAAAGAEGADAEGAHALELWPLDRSRSRAFCVTDDTVAGLYAAELDGLVSATVTIAAGEQHKTLSTAESIWRALIEAGADRGDHLVALGGGVVGDLAGFCAATYQRGIPVVQLPTTLLAQVDSAYGGKTGVDLPQAKNYVGSYHQPAGVLVDPDTLASLPERELAAGLVEVLKTALIAGGPLWARVASGDELDDWTILACARTKLAVVEADERDGGRRQVLNLGHTVGHAIETATGYSRYRHGEAIGLGLLAALRLSGANDLREQVREMLHTRDLPVRLEDANLTEQIVLAAARDKKRIGETLPFVLLDTPGEPRIGCEVSPADLRAAVAELAKG